MMNSIKHYRKINNSENVKQAKRSHCRAIATTLSKRNEVSLLPNPRLSHSTGTSPRRKPNANTDNHVIGFCHSNYSCWREGLNGFRSQFIELQRVGMSRRRERMDYWCIPLFLPCFLVFFFATFVIFLYSITLSFFFLYSPQVPPRVFLYLWLPFPFYIASFYGISLFCPQGFIKFWFLIGIFPRLPTDPLVA